MPLGLYVVFVSYIIIQTINSRLNDQIKQLQCKIYSAINTYISAVNASNNQNIPALTLTSIGIQVDLEYVFILVQNSQNVDGGTFERMLSLYI